MFPWILFFICIYGLIIHFYLCKSRKKLSYLVAKGRETIDRLDLDIAELERRVNIYNNKKNSFKQNIHTLSPVTLLHMDKIIKIPLIREDLSDIKFEDITLNAVVKDLQELKFDTTNLVELPDCKTIHKRTKTLSLKNHPDKGGDKAKFEHLQQANERLQALCAGSKDVYENDLKKKLEPHNIIDLQFALVPFIMKKRIKT